MALQRLTAALASGNAEIQFALATLNLDVSLIKMEAPKEFRPLALALPAKRKDEAEDGSIHATARKLQALFSRLYTATPELYSAYGERCSFISQQVKMDENDVKAGGPFAEHIGIEAGSIWAAATSGTTAIAVHLLACMLARLFQGPEAVAAWEEIVAIRKKQILDEADTGTANDISALLAARTSLNRQDLAEWDTSARAWLRVSDQVMQSKQTQLLLIINNQQSLPVNFRGTTFESIVQAWSQAMDAVNKLIRGMPQSIKDGSILLALSAWHIYPDMLVLGDKTVLVEQHDTLVANGGVLTLGLQMSSTKVGTPSNEGVTWSLPLAYYRYYGTPTVTDRSIQADGTRLSSNQLLLIVIGGLMSKWTEQALTSVQMAKFIAKLFAHVTSASASASREQDIYMPSARSWPSILRSAAEAFAMSAGIEQEDGSRLIAYGRRRCGAFLGVMHGRDSPISQLQHIPVFLSLLSSADDMVRLLRRVARRLRVPSDHLIIRYKLNGPGHGTLTRYGYANVNESGLVSNTASIRKNLCRWEGQARPLHGSKEEQPGLIESNIIKAPVKDDLRLFWCDPPMELQANGSVQVGVDQFFGHFAERAIFKTLDSAGPRKLNGVPFYFLLGDPSTAAIYQAYESPPNQNYLLHTEEILPSLDDVLEGRLRTYFVNAMLPTKQKTALKLSSLVCSLKAVATIIQTYEYLPGATIASTLLKHPIADAKWVPDPVLRSNAAALPLTVIDLTVEELKLASSDHSASILVWEPYDMDRPSTFACIAMMESGTANIAPNGLGTVMALSSSDSLFVACQLVNDPVQQPNAIVTHLRGNIGRPGISMLIPPSQELFTIDVDDWNQIDHKHFDGELRDSFKSTSLHLSFTGFDLAVDTGVRGLRSTEVTLVETVVSVHERGVRVADLDVLSKMDTPLLRIVSSGKRCQHSHSSIETTYADYDDDAEPLVSLDSWAEFLDSPAGPGVFRARGNWQARLAAATMSISREFLTVVFEGEVCWHCGRAESDRMRHKKKTVYLI